MKILAINGSPKGKKSSTNLMIENFLKGAENQGAQVEQIFLKEKKINFCTGCYTCWTKTPGRCIFKDDMENILSKVSNADILILGSPLYCNNITGNLKVFIDRLLPLGTPYFEKDNEGIYKHNEINSSRWKPKLMMFSNCGFPELIHFEVVSLWIKKFARNCSGTVLGEIYKGQGPLMAANSSNLSPIISEYKNSLFLAGEEIVLNNKISEKTQQELEKDFLPHEEFIKLATQMWDKNRK